MEAGSRSTLGRLPRGDVGGVKTVKTYLPSKVRLLAAVELLTEVVCVQIPQNADSHPFTGPSETPQTVLNIPDFSVLLSGGFPIYVSGVQQWVLGAVNWGTHG